MQRQGVNIDFVVDINPAKQGKYLAATGLQVSSPEVIINNLPANTTIFIMNSNYLNEVKNITRNQFNYLTVDHGII